MKQTLTRLWQKPWGKALIAASYSAATILVYFALAQAAFVLWHSTWLPPIGRPPVQEQASTTDPAEMQRLWSFHPYTGPGSPNYNQPAQVDAPQAPVQPAPPASNPQAPSQIPDNSALMPPPLPGLTR